MKTSYLLFAFSINLLTFTHSQAAGNPAQGEALSGACASCHGRYGLSNSDDYPNLAGQKQAYLIKTLQQYQSGKRSGDLTMQAIVGPLSTQDIENLAAYFAGNTPIPSYSQASKQLHLPAVSVAGQYYQADLQQSSDKAFELITVKPLP